MDSSGKGRGRRMYPDSLEDGGPLPAGIGMAVRLQARCLCGHSRLVHRFDGECGLCETCGAFTVRAGDRLRARAARVRALFSAPRGRRCR